MRGRTVAGMVLAVALLPVGTAAANVKSYPTTLDVGTATGTSIGGSVDSPKGACLRDRRVDLSQPDSPGLNGTTTTNKAGKWNINLNPTSEVEVGVAKRTIRKHGRKFKCKAVSSGLVDVIGPAVVIVSPDDDAFTTSTGTIIYTTGDAVSATCELNAQGSTCGFGSAPQFFQYSNLPDGHHTFEIIGTDLSGNETKASVTWNVDSEPPTVQGFSILSAGGTGGSVQFTLRDASEISEIHCDLDGVESLCGSGTFGSQDWDGLVEHRIEVWGVDEWGNSGETAPAATAPSIRAFTVWDFGQPR